MKVAVWSGKMLNKARQQKKSFDLYQIQDIIYFFEKRFEWLCTIFFQQIEIIPVGTYSNCIYGS